MFIVKSIVLQCACCAHMLLASDMSGHKGKSARGQKYRRGDKTVACVQVAEDKQRHALKESDRALAEQVIFKA